MFFGFVCEAKEMTGSKPLPHHDGGWDRRQAQAGLGGTTCGASLANRVRGAPDYSRKPPPPDLK